MSELFILQNDAQLFLSKQGAWVDGRDLNQLYKSPYKDEAINQMVEVSAKDFRQRIKVLTCNANEKGLPQLDPEWLPEPLPKVAKDLFEADVTAVSDALEAVGDAYVDVEVTPEPQNDALDATPEESSDDSLVAADAAADESVDSFDEKTSV